jgi:hypothetical protein
MNTKDNLDDPQQLLLTEDHHELIQQYRKAMHLHGDPSQSENESDSNMRESISQADSLLVSADLH